MPVMYDETATALYKRLYHKNLAFQWPMLNSNRGMVTHKFGFDEIVGVTARSKDMQELRLDLLLSFSKNVKASVLVIHASLDNSLSCALAQGNEDKNPFVLDLTSRDCLKCVTLSSALQLYALLDLLEQTLNEPSPIGGSAPDCTLLILDNLEPLFHQHQQSVSRQGNSSSPHITADIPAKLQSLVEAQSVLCMWVKESSPSTSVVPPRSDSLAVSSTIEQLLKRRLHYFPRTDAM
jgi:hypothetical protein